MAPSRTHSARMTPSLSTKIVSSRKLPMLRPDGLNDHV